VRLSDIEQSPGGNDALHGTPADAAGDGQRMDLLLHTMHSAAGKALWVPFQGFVAVNTGRLAMARRISTTMDSLSAFRDSQYVPPALEIEQRSRGAGDRLRVVGIHSLRYGVRIGMSSASHTITDRSLTLTAPAVILEAVGLHRVRRPLRDVQRRPGCTSVPSRFGSGVGYGRYWHTSGMQSWSSSGSQSTVQNVSMPHSSPSSIEMSHSSGSMFWLQSSADPE
jgi:hypothetical protein